jgi:hypothetical protein
MFVIHLPTTVRIGDTHDCRINQKPARVTWRDAETLVIEPGDARRIVRMILQSRSSPGSRNLDNPSPLPKTKAH